MRKLYAISVLSLLLLSVSCGSDKPDDLPVSLTASGSKSYVLVTAANTPQSPQVTFTMSDFAAISQYVKYVESGEVLSSSTFIEVTGISSGQEVELTGVGLTLASDAKKSISLPTITSNVKFEADTASRLGFFQSIMSEILRKGSSTVTLRYSSSGLMTNENTKLVIQINTRFSF